MDQKPTLICTVPPKTGGMSLLALLQKKMKTRRIYWREQPNAFDVINREQNLYEAFHGHFGYGVHQFLDVDVDYCTIIRHPVDRAVSYYTWIRQVQKNNPDQPGRDLALSSDLVTFCENYPRVQDGQCIQLAGFHINVMDPPIGMKCNHTLFEKALLHLSRCRFVGVTEELDKLAAQLSDHYEWGPCTMPLDNVTPGKRPPLTKDQRDRILELNEYDLELYEEAKRLSAV